MSSQYQYPILNNKPIDQWKVTELKEELRKRKIPVKGLKEELVRKLDESIRIEREMSKKQEVGNSFNPDPGIQDVRDQVGEDLVAKGYTDMAADLSAKTENNAAIVKIDGNTLVVNQGNQDEGRNLASFTGLDSNALETTIPTIPMYHFGDSAPFTGSHPTAKETTVPAVAMYQDGNSPLLTVSNPTVMEATVHAVPVDQSGDSTLFTESYPTVIETTVPAVLVEDIATASQTMVHDYDYSGQDSKTDEKDKDLKPNIEDTKLNLSELENQVSEVSPDLGSQVKSESIPTDSMSINEINKLKDNINADNFHLELEVVQPEMVHPSSCNFPPIGGNLHHLDDNKEPVKNLISLEEVDCQNATNLDISKKEENVDVCSPEMLNLDRSSGDESMEEDVLESKHVESNFKSQELGDPIEVSKAHAIGEGSIDAMKSESIPCETNAVEEEPVEPTAPTEKRKLEDHEAIGNSENVKRQRRWNSETIKAPERQVSNFSTSNTPTSAFQPTPRRAFSRSDSKPGESSPKERFVPPSQKPATTSLKIDRFLRPFTLKAVQELLGKTGTVCSFWMDQIKTHCYVTYSKAEEAIATRNAVYNLQWPPNGGNLLVAEFVDPKEVRVRVETPPQAPAPSPSPTTTKANLPQPQQAPARHYGLRQQPAPPPLPQLPVLSDPPGRERLPSPLPKKPEPPALTLDDLFLKTKASPRIYFLPLTEEQVAAKLAAQGKSIQE